MGKVVKVVAIFVVFVLLILVAAFFAVKFYLTPDRVKTMLVLPAKQFLRREVYIKDVSVNIFGGVSLKGVEVKEKNGKDNFVEMRIFALRYKLLPLIFRRKLVVSSILLEGLRVNIFRDKNGHFNFESLGPLVSLANRETPSNRSGGALGKGVPFAVDVRDIDIKDAKISVRDEIKAFPRVDLNAEARLTVSFESPESVYLAGRVETFASIFYKDIKALFKGRFALDPEKLVYNCNVSMDKDNINISGEIKNYRRAPFVIVKLASNVLHIDTLMALKSITSKKKKDFSAAKNKRTTVFSKSAFPSLKVEGSYSLDTVLYKDLSIRDVYGKFSFLRGVFSLREGSMKVAGGVVSYNLKLDIRHPYKDYSGVIVVKDVQLGELLKSFTSLKLIDGVVTSYMEFSGRGVEWKVARRYLTASGNFSIEDGAFLDVPVVNKLAYIVDIPWLRNARFKRIVGRFNIEKGKLFLNSSVRGEGFDAKIGGFIRLDGYADLPVVIRVKRGTYNFEVPVRLKGSISSLRPVLDKRFIEERFIQQILH